MVGDEHHWYEAARWFIYFITSIRISPLIFLSWSLWLSVWLCQGSTAAVVLDQRNVGLLFGAAWRATPPLERAFTFWAQFWCSSKRSFRLESQNWFCSFFKNGGCCTGSYWNVHCGTPCGVETEADGAVATQKKHAKWCQLWIFPTKKIDLLKLGSQWN